MSAVRLASTRITPLERGDPKKEFVVLEDPGVGERDTPTHSTGSAMRARPPVP